MDFNEIIPFFNNPDNIPQDYKTEYIADHVNKLQEATVAIASYILQNLNVSFFDNHQNYTGRNIPATSENDNRHIGEAISCRFNNEIKNLQEALDEIFTNYIGY